MRATAVQTWSKNSSKSNRHQILLVKIGDFYETFMEDAEILSRVAGLTRTSSSVNGETPIVMCGFPFHMIGSVTEVLAENGIEAFIL
jgi:DNA mismatch repair protein MutS